ncbi:hypothetical protein CCHR01_09690 [Colletotrichum chrysophilum]|uniref:Uncharacterized protein n=1 Tax=Colletotrichum chrysophilum TaxID=1836956 RepID=A0AAD9AGH8_9PEZI|nr:hypothetical protein CCHR01_09690 [Colletotrichum chrysophilum]
MVGWVYLRWDLKQMWHNAADENELLRSDEHPRHGCVFGGGLIAHRVRWASARNHMPTPLHWAGVTWITLYRLVQQVVNLMNEVAQIDCPLAPFAPGTPSRYMSREHIRELKDPHAMAYVGVMMGFSAVATTGPSRWRASFNSSVQRDGEHSFPASSRLVSSLHSVQLRLKDFALVGAEDQVSKWPLVARTQTDISCGPDAQLRVFNILEGLDPPKVPVA